MSSQNFNSYEEMYQAQRDQERTRFQQDWRKTNSRRSYSSQKNLNYRSRATLQRKMEDYLFYLAVFPIGGMVVDIDTRRVQELRSSATKKITSSQTFTVNLYNIIDDIPASNTWKKDTKSTTYFTRFVCYELAKQMILYVHSLDELKMEEKVNLLETLIPVHFGVKVLKNLYAIPLFFQYLQPFSTVTERY